MFARNVFRVVAVAVGLSTLSFAAGVAGDLSVSQTPNYGERVVLRLPPAIPGDAPRAAPLLSTATAEAIALPQQRAIRFEPVQLRSVDAELLVNDYASLSLAPLPKLRTVWAAKPALRPTEA